MIIKKIDSSNILPALDFSLNVFIKFNSSNYPDEGINLFKDSIFNSENINSREYFGAYIDNILVGVIASNKDYSHISLLFVDGNYHKMGIGRQLFNKVKSLCIKNYITVNSSLYAYSFYKHLGFYDTCGMVCVKGFSFYPMRLDF